MEINEDATRLERKEAVSQYLTFEISGEEYAVALLKIREIIGYQQITKVPKMPGWVRGVINLRGAVVPVIDLALIFRQAPTELGRQTCIIIAEVASGSGDTVMGILVDAVRQVVEWRNEDIEAPPTFGTRIRIEYLLGMGCSGSNFSPILDTDKLLSIDELMQLQESIQAPAAGLETEQQ